MLSEALSLELEGWQSQKESLEEFIQIHSFQLVKEFAKAGLHNNGWKTAGRCSVYV
jgi:hypothetical protein